MSVAAIIIGARTEHERDFYVPVSNENFFQKYWMKAANELKLPLLSYLDPGIDVTKNDLDILFGELDMLKE